MRTPVLLVCFCFLAQAGFTQRDSSKIKALQKTIEQLKLQTEKNFYEKNKANQKVTQDSKVVEAQKQEGIISRDAQKLQDAEKQQQDKAQSFQKASAQITGVTVIGTPGEEDKQPANTPVSKSRLQGPAPFDSRIEILDLDPMVDWHLRILQNAGSVGLIVRKELLQPLTDSIMRLSVTQTLQRKYNLCPGEAFAKQPVLGEGTAFVIDTNTLITASHVIIDSINQYAVVFGYKLINKVGSYETDIPVTSIYYLTSFIHYDDELDVAMIKVDRAMTVPALQISNRAANIADKVYAIGYPSGLPEKLSINASVTSNELQYFYTSLDAFQGNSGSPVFNLDTHQVIGILVSGEVDYRSTGSCNTVTICSIPFCKGEKVIRISEAIKNRE